MIIVTKIQTIGNYICINFTSKVEKARITEVELVKMAPFYIFFILIILHHYNKYMLQIYFCIYKQIVQ